MHRAQKLRLSAEKGYYIRRKFRVFTLSKFERLRSHCRVCGPNSLTAEFAVRNRSLGLLLRFFPRMKTVQQRLTGSSGISVSYHAHRSDCEGFY